MMNIEDRREELLIKANSLIDKISESMRTVENVEAAIDKFIRPDATISLDIPVEGSEEYNDVFKLEEIFDKKKIEKIKAYILTELQLLEEEALKILDQAGISEPCARVEQCTDNAPQSKPEEWEALDKEEDDSDMIIVPDKVKQHSRKPLSPETAHEIERLAKAGEKPAAIAEKTGVSCSSAVRYSKMYSEGLTMKEIRDSGRSVSKPRY